MKMTHRRRRSTSSSTANLLIRCGYYYSGALLAACCCKAQEATTPNIYALQVDGFVDSQFCYDQFLLADEDDDGFINFEEYVTIAQALSPPGLIDDVVSPEDLPFAFTSTYSTIACFCQVPSFGGDLDAEDCCTGSDAAIRVPENPADPDTPATDASYLYAACFLTQGAAQSVLDSPFPTVPPPSAAPTATPTLTPTVSPTAAPTFAPTDSPTVSPTESPTKNPTSSPTAAPTLSPTVSPTLDPTVAPTVAPTVSPTEAPVTPAPVLPEFTLSPTDAPSPSEPTTSEPSPSEPTTLEPSPSEPTTSEPSPSEPTTSEPSPSEPTTSEPSPSEPTTSEPSPSEPTTSEPSPSEPTTSAPSPSEPTTSAPSPSEPTTPAPSPSEPAPVTPPTEPTVSPTTASPTASPTTAEPTVSPAPTVTASPTLPAVQVNATTTYDIGVRGGAPVESYLSDLNVAMDALALAVWDGAGRRRLRRKLVATVQLPTNFGAIDEIDCPASVTEEGDVCQELTSVVTIEYIDEEASLEQVSRYEADLIDSIFEGGLQRELDLVNPDSPVTVLTGLVPPPGGERPIEGDSDSLSTGATVGITLAAVAVVLISIFASRRFGGRGSGDKDAAEVDYAEQDNEGSSSRPAGQLKELDSVDDSSLFTDSAAAVQFEEGAANLGAGQPDYGKMETGDDIVAEPEMENYEDSSDAGNSGWSSSAGFSSLNTGSMDDSMDAAVAAGATLAALGAGSALAAKSSKRSKSSGISSSDDISTDRSASREQLDNLIEAGDWAAVGATAALLAAASDSQSQSSRSRATTRSTGSSDVDAARAAELDHLVDAGDWEGVVLAAAKFQAGQPDDHDKSSGGRDGSSADSGSDSNTGTGTGTAGSPSISTSLTDDTPSKAAKRAEVRGEVEALVRRVVPEEIDNVDEMMNQFKGREDELVETLRTMQERAVAQKARTAGQKAAKVKAKQMVKAQRVAGVDQAAAAGGGGAGGAAVAAAAGGAVGLAAVVGAAAAASDSKSDQSSKPSERETRTALELAIESGDWGAVGEAAALLEEGSVGTMSTGELDRLADASSLESSDASITRKRSQLKGVDAERAQKLDNLIDVGDWKGVISAANEFSASEKKPQSKMSKEEEDALQQAEAWMKIAQEKKAEGATDAGASDAAEWAIQRSLSQMKEADKKKPAKEEEDEV